MGRRGAFIDFLGYLALLSLGGVQSSIFELRGVNSHELIYQREVPISGRILKVLTSGKEQKSETQVKFEKVIEALNGFVRNHKEDQKYKEKMYQSRKKVITEEVKYLRVRYKSILHIKTRSISTMAIFIFADAISSRLAGVRNDLEIEMDDREEITDKYVPETEEWHESHVKYAQLKEEPDRQSGLSICFE